MIGWAPGVPDSPEKESGLEQPRKACWVEGGQRMGRSCKGNTEEVLGEGKCALHCNVSLLCEKWFNIRSKGWRCLCGLLSVLGTGDTIVNKTNKISIPCMWDGVECGG